VASGERHRFAMSMRRWVGVLLIAGGLVAAAVSLFYYLDYRREQVALERFLSGRPGAVAGGSPVALVEDLTTFLGTLPDGETTARMPYQNPLYAVLKARPIDVLEHGGFCGNRSRLLVTLLHLRGIPARVTYLYNEAGWTRPDVGQPYVTAFVEVRIDDRWVVADPYIGVLFRNRAGLPATAAELAADPDLVRVMAPKWYRPEFFNYREIRGIRWGKFPMGEQVRSGIARLASTAWADGIHYPWWAQRPNLLFAGVSGAAAILALSGGWALVRRRASRPRRG